MAEKVAWASLGWSDGVAYMPVNSCLLSSENAKSRINEAQKKAAEVVPELLSAAKKAGIQAHYVLFDSCFSSPKVIRAMKEQELDTVAMVKKSDTIRYCYQGQKLSCKSIYSLNMKRRGRSRCLLTVDVQIDAAREGEEVIPAKLVYVRNRSNRKDYLVLLSTYTTLTEDEIIQLYGKRWDIEVFFKTCKSILRLTKECRSICYDAMCAQTAIVFLRFFSSKRGCEV